MDAKVVEDNKSAVILVLSLIVVMVAVLALITYLFFGQEEYDNSDLPPIVETPVEQAPAPIIDEAQIPALPENAVIPDANVAQAPAQSAPAARTTARLKYIIKPNNKDIVECRTMRNGRWTLPNDCAQKTMDSINDLINANTELIALEVSGIVDSSPYAEPSAELKQEGLASFRAREAIKAINRAYSSVAAFEGPSIQADNKRGFQVKAYYLQK